MVALTSKLAHKELLRTGNRQDQIERVAVAITYHPGHTASELTKYTSLDRYQIGRRLSEAEAQGLIFRGGIRRCQITKRMCYEWHPVHSVWE